MKYFGRLLLILAFLPAISFASANDRRELVTGVYSIFAPLARLLTQQPEFAALTGEQQRNYRAVLEQINKLSIQLVFEKDGFVLAPGEAPRMMKTPIGQPGEIHVNEPLLNSVEDADVALIAQFFFHEFGHKVPSIPLKDRDHVARVLENFVRKFAKRSEIDGGLVVRTISVPATAIDESVGGTTPGPQPVNLLLMEYGGKIRDATKALTAAATDAEEQTQSVWTEGRERLLGIPKILEQAIREKLVPEIEIFNANAREIGVKDDASVDSMMKMMGFNLEELRVLEMLSTEGAAVGDDFYLRIKASYLITRSQRKTVTLNTNGFDLGEPEAVPITIAIRVPKTGAVSKDNFGIHLRPRYSEEADVRVSGVVRSPLGAVDILRLDWKSETEPPKDLRLSVLYDVGLRMIPAKSRELAKPGLWKIEFQIPWERMTPVRPSVAESLVIDGDRALDLDRLIVLTATSTGPAPEPRLNHLVNAGLWTVEGKEVALRDRFDPMDPLMIADGLNTQRPTFSPSEMYMDFELERPEPVAEVRLHYRMLTAILKTEPGQRVKPALLKWWDGQSALMAVEGKLKFRRDYLQVMSNWGENNRSSKTSRGTMMTRVKFKIPLKLAGELTAPEEAHLIPMLQPMFIEIVMEDGQVLRRTLDTGAACNRDLTGG